MAGNLLMGFAVLGGVGTAVMAVSAFAGIVSTRPESDRHTEACAAFLFSGAVWALEVILFLAGRYLRQPRPAATGEAESTRRPRRPLPLAVYLVGSAGLGLVAGLGNFMHLMNFRPWRPLVFLLYPPTFFTELLLGGLLGFRPHSGPAGQAVLVAANLAYFVAFFYPVYSMVTMDRAVEAVRYRRMKIILILFVTVHLLTCLAFVTAMQA
jgi:hypothetical protein